MLKWLKGLFHKVQPEIEKAYYKGEILVCEWTDGSATQYKGDCTVWYHYPSMSRCGTYADSKLFDIWSYIKEHGGPYPTAHLNK